ncbi:hypothetical protein SO802_026302 [Lithocarpus litseifolius]|uniref:Uncharacterized protein n=1 Tax=Lithocarpus litseifolius TaxID=425828 RepID=A0AAW2BZP0_9ROSI
MTSNVGKRKGISNSVDLGDLPTHQGSKKQKSGKTPPPKVPNFPSVTVHLDASAVNLVPQTTPSVQTTPPVQPEDLSLIAKTPYKAHHSEKTKHPLNLLLDESYAWRTFKGIITDNVGIEQKLKNEVEELKADSIKKETHIAHLEVKVQEFTSSMEKA